MKLGVFTVLFSEKSLEDMLDYVKDAGLDMVEIGTGGYPGNAHCDLDELLASEEKRAEFLEKVHSRGLEIRDRKSTRLNSSHVAISYAVFCLKKKICKILTYIMLHDERFFTCGAVRR